MVCLEQWLLQMCIRETDDADLNCILFVEGEAFNSDKEANLTMDLFADRSAKPLLSLMAFVEGQPAGHILFTAARLSGVAREVAVSFLAPLAVVPVFQRRGVGGSLIKNGLERLSRSGVDLVFVVGHPQYYPRHGFTPAGKLGFETPYPMPVEHADAWMVRALRPDVIGSVSGKVVCCDTLNKPELWQG
jgi:putative acetyltransferase